MTIAIQHIDVNVTTDGSTISIGADAPLDRQFSEMLSKEGCLLVL
jgi:hypothetical protein